MNNPPQNHNTPPEDSSDDLIDTVLRIGELRAEVEKAAGTPIAESMAPGMPLRMQEAFWQHALDFENAPLAPLQATLRERCGFQAVPIEDLDTDEKLHQALWDLIRALASIRYFLHFTDHLSDRQLYRLLVEEVLPEETEIPPEGSAWNTRCDMAEFPTPEFPNLSDCWLAFYADDETRELWAHDFPEDPIPPRKNPPHDRDRHLPNPDR